MNARIAIASLLSMILLVGCGSPQLRRSKHSRPLGPRPILAPRAQSGETDVPTYSTSQLSTDTDVIDICVPHTELSVEEFQFSRALAAYAEALLAADVDLAAPNTLELYEKLVRLDPQSIPMAMRLANAYRELERFDDSVRVLKAARNTHPEDSDLQILLAFVYQVSNDPTNAILEFDRLREMSPQEPESYVRLANCHLILGQTDEALRTLDLALRTVKERQQIVDACRLIADQFADFGDIKTAIKSLRVLYDNGQLDPMILATLVGFELAAGATQEADKIVKDLPEQYSTSAELLGGLAALYYETGNFDQAIELFQKAEIRACESDRADIVLTGQFYFRYAACQERLKQFHAAESLFLKVLELNSDSHVTMNYLAYMWAERDEKLDDALEFVLRALELEPQNAAYIDTLGWVYYKLDRDKEALEQIQRAQALLPTDPVLADHLGDVYAALSDDQRAVASWETSYRLDPDNATVAGKLSSNGIDLEKLLLDIKTSEPTK